MIEERTIPKSPATICIDLMRTSIANKELSGCTWANTPTLAYEGNILIANEARNPKNPSFGLSETRLIM